MKVRRLYDREGFPTEEARQLETTIEQAVTELLQVCVSRGYDFRDVTGVLHRVVASAEVVHSLGTKAERREAQEARQRRNEERRERRKA